MAFRRRRDGILLDGIPPLRRVIPYLLRTRTSSAVYFPQRIDVTDVVAWLRTANAARGPQDHLTVFHVVLTAVGRTLRLRPEVNRFVAGRRTYQHTEISVSFIVKTAMHDDAPETEVRLVLTGRESVEEVAASARAAIEAKRAAPHGDDDRLVELFARWPRPALELASRVVSVLDYHNALPAPLVDAIPLYTSAYVVNAGSLGIDAPFHHLYENGSSSVFVSVGRVADVPVVHRGQVVPRPCLDVVYTLDERATDGFYFARTAEVFRRLVADPSLLADPELTVDEILAGWPEPV